MNDLEKEIESTSLLVEELDNDLKKATSRLEMLRSSTQPTISEILRDFDKYFSVSKKKKRQTIPDLADDGSAYIEGVEYVVCKERSAVNMYISLEQQVFLHAYIRHLYDETNVELILNQKQ